MAEKYKKEDGRPVHYFLGEDLLTPHVNRCDGGRLNMFISHSAQFLTLKDGEIPLVFTRFENQIGKYSQGVGYSSLKENCIFVKSITRDNEKYLFFAFQDNTIDVVRYTSSTRLTESYGFVNKYVFDDSIEPGSEVKEGTLISHNEMFDSELNMKYGVNLNSVFLAKDGLTFEDAIILSEEGAAKFDHNTISDAVVSINNNDILINRYGSKTVYKPFPDVGEEIKGGILCSRRRINYASVVVDFKNADNITKESDSNFFFEGRVEGIEVFSNLPPAELQKESNAPLKKIIDEQNIFYTDIFETIKSLKDEGFTLRSDCGYLFQKAKDMLSGKKFNYDKSEFEGSIIRFRIARTVKLKPGSKITGR